MVIFVWGIAELGGIVVLLPTSLPQNLCSMTMEACSHSSMVQHAAWGVASCHMRSAHWLLADASFERQKLMFTASILEVQLLGAC